MRNVLVLYYSSYGHIEQMAYAQAEGVAGESGMQVVVKRVPELVPPDVAKASGYKVDQRAPIATIDELPQYDAIIFGTPTRFGNMTAQMRNFLDQTGGLWAQGALVGRIASVFCSTASQHGGQETTITSFHLTLLHHGMIIVGLPYTYRELSQMAEIAGGTPYGASCVTGVGDTLRMPTPFELQLCRYQGQHVARIAARMQAAS